MMNRRGRDASNLRYVDKDQYSRGNIASSNIRKESCRLTKLNSVRSNLLLLVNSELTGKKKNCHNEAKINSKSIVEFEKQHEASYVNLKKEIYISSPMKWVFASVNNITCLNEGFSKQTKSSFNQDRPPTHSNSHSFSPSPTRVEELKDKIKEKVKLSTTLNLKKCEFKEVEKGFKYLIKLSKKLKRDKIMSYCSLSSTRNISTDHSYETDFDNDKGVKQKHLEELTSHYDSAYNGQIIFKEKEFNLDRDHKNVHVEKLPNKFHSKKCSMAFQSNIFRDISIDTGINSSFKLRTNKRSCTYK